MKTYDDDSDLKPRPGESYDDHLARLNSTYGTPRQSARPTAKSAVPRAGLPTSKATTSKAPTFDVTSHFKPGEIRELSEEYATDIETMTAKLRAWYTNAPLRSEFGSNRDSYLSHEFSHTAVSRAFRRTR